MPKVSFGCIVVEGAPLPDGININELGRFEWFGKNPDPNPTGPQPNVTGVILDLTPQRVKSFKGLKHDATYYFYYFAINTAGVSILSEVVSIVCW